MRRKLLSFVAALLAVPVIAWAATGGGVPANLARVSTGSLSIGFDTGCTAAQTLTANYTKVGNLVFWRLSGGFTCTSNTTSQFTNSSAQVPAGLRPAATVQFPAFTIQNNGAFDAAGGCIAIQSNGFVGIIRSVSFPCDGTAWTNTGTRGLLTSSGALQLVYSTT